MPAGSNKNHEKYQIGTADVPAEFRTGRPPHMSQKRLPPEPTCSCTSKVICTLLSFNINMATVRSSEMGTTLI
jgi:hypothetical protein